MADPPAAAPDEALAACVVTGLGRTPVSVERLGGVVNAVFRVHGPDVDWVVRFPAVAGLPDEFPREAWAARAARRSGVPVAETVHVGQVGRAGLPEPTGSIPVMVVAHVPSGPGAPDRPWRWMGKYAAALAGAPLDGAPEAVYSRFGRDLAAAWRAHLAYNVAALEEGDPLADDGAYDPTDRAALQEWVASLDHLAGCGGLAHGDLDPRNLVGLGRGTPPVLVDWGTVTTGPAPWTDLQRVYHRAVLDEEITREDLADFWDGTGLTQDARAAEVLRRMTALRLLDLTRWARDRRPDLYSEHRDACARGLARLGPSSET